MNVVILCDSKFGNTQRLAEAMQGALSPTHDVQVRRPADGLPDPEAIDVLIVGGPTHAHGASQPLKAALKALPDGSLKRTRVAAFDTRFRMAKLLTGSAAGSAAKLLKHAGVAQVAPVESFFVTREDPPTLDPGEVERAAAWVRDVVH